MGHVTTLNKLPTKCLKLNEEDIFKALHKRNSFNV